MTAVVWCNRKGCQILRCQSDRWLWGTWYVCAGNWTLSARVLLTLNCWAVSPAQSLGFESFKTCPVGICSLCFLFAVWDVSPQLWASGFRGHVCSLLPLLVSHRCQPSPPMNCFHSGACLTAIQKNHGPPGYVFISKRNFLSISMKFIPFLHQQTI